MVREPQPRIAQLLNWALARIMRQHPDVLLLGEDLADPYGGAFKITQGLSSEFGDRVISTPISEAGFTGMGVGLALGGLRPVVEIMFGDFITLAVDQIVNQASKIASMFGRPVNLPLVVRTPMGGGRGYGPTHSQSLERLFFGTPGLEVTAISAFIDPGVLLENAIASPRPVLFIENKLLYSQALITQKDLDSLGYSRRCIAPPVPTVLLEPGQTPDITVIAYGRMASLALNAADVLQRREGLVCELVIPHRLSPLDSQPLLESAARTRRVVTVEEGVANFGFGAEVSHMVHAVGLEAPVQRVGASFAPIPARRDLEDQVLPGVDDIVTAAITTVDVDFQSAEGEEP